MKKILILLLFVSKIFASFGFITSFEADFTQSVTDEKNKVLKYRGSVSALKPQKAIWNYTNPVKKDIFINTYCIVMIEPEIEQVIIKNIKSNFDFFNIIKNAKKINKDYFLAKYKKLRFFITTKNDLIKSISYKDEFDNKVKIIFKNQKQNGKINPKIFIPKIPKGFDVIKDF